MKADPNNNLELEPELLDLIEGTRPITQKDLEELGKAIRALDDDPEYIAISLKADVITEIYHAMHEQGLTPSKLARKWGKSRQYLSKILSEDKRVNFTVDTIAEIMVLLGRRVELHFPKRDEHTVVIRCLREPVKPGWKTPAVTTRGESIARFRGTRQQPDPKLTRYEHNSAA